jgi:hypothetical protein
MTDEQWFSVLRRHADRDDAHDSRRVAAHDHERSARSSYNAIGRRLAGPGGAIALRSRKGRGQALTRCAAIEARHQECASQCSCSVRSRCTHTSRRSRPRN